MEICILASGSGGNSIFVRTKYARILIDAGISTRQIKKRLDSIGEDLADLDALFISHEHTDHIKSASALSRKLPVHINKATYENSPVEISNPIFFSNNMPVTVEDVTLYPTPTSHDAADPCGFVIKNCSKSIGIFTDLGQITENIVQSVEKLDSLVIEFNHDIDMLLNSRYPYPLKQRIMGEKGHLSNIDAALFLNEYATSRLKTAFLAHMSQNSNTPDLAMTTFKNIVKKEVKPILTSQAYPTEITEII